MKEKERRFNYHWGSGYIVEEAQVQGQHHQPTFQLLRYTEGPAAGEVGIRFCYYSQVGRFQRSPLLMSSEDMALMREALSETPELRSFLAELVAEPTTTT